MTIFLCEPGYTGILSGIYDAGVSKIPQDELRLEIKNSGQNVELFAVYRECSPSEEKGKKVLETVRQRLNSHIQEQLYVASLSEDVLRADKMYRYLKVLFLRGEYDEIQRTIADLYYACEKFEELGIPVEVIGDAAGARDCTIATREGYDAGMAI